MILILTGNLQSLDYAIYVFDEFCFPMVNISFFLRNPNRKDVKLWHIISGNKQQTANNKMATQIPVPVFVSFAIESLSFISMCYTYMYSLIHMKYGRYFNDRAGNSF